MTNKFHEENGYCPECDPFGDSFGCVCEEKTNVQGLFVDVSEHGIYPRLLGAENCWGVERDARLYPGPDPVVAHPPCNLWVNMAAVNWKRYRRQKPAWYPGGRDGGMFASALASVLEHGGALEHPAESHAWRVHGLADPYGVGWTWSLDVLSRKKYWTCEVWQSAYGNAARKRTWLLYCGKRPPFELLWVRNPGTHQVGWFDRNKPTLSKRMASATPAAFAKTLIALARWSRDLDYVPSEADSSRLIGV